MIAIVMLLIRDYVKLIVLSIVIGVPIVYFLMNGWLQNFAYHLSISPWVFIIAGSAVLLISILTVIVQTLKSALANPVDALRYE
jgi:putative ABC transport system permease protein